MSRTKTITLTLGSLAAGAVIATGITGVALAADSSPTPSSSATSSATSSAGSSAGAKDGPDRGGQRDHGPGRGGRGGLLGERGSEPLHGEMVVKAADGTVSTVQMVRGTVTAVTASSITVKAEDGYTATFAVGATTEVRVGLPVRGSDPSTSSTDTIADVKVGDVADVHGTVSAGTATATEVRAMTAAEAAQLEADRAAHEQAG